MKHILAESMGHCRAVGVPFQMTRALLQAHQGEVTRYRVERTGTGGNSPT